MYAADGSIVNGWLTKSNGYAFKRLGVFLTKNLVVRRMLFRRCPYTFATNDSIAVSGGLKEQKIEYSTKDNRST